MDKYKIMLVVSLIFLILLTFSGCSDSKEAITPVESTIDVGSTIDKNIVITYRTDNDIKKEYDYSEFTDDFWWSGKLEVSDTEKMPSGIYYVTYSGQLVASK